MYLRPKFTCVHVHVKLPSRQDAHPQAPWRHNEGGARCGAHTHKHTRVALKHGHQIEQTEKKKGGGGGGGVKGRWGPRGYPS